MNKETAIRRGYEDTGCYEFSRTPEMEARLSEIKSKGYKALIVFVPSSPCSRGHHGGGYSIVAEPRYRLDNCANSMRREIGSHEAKCANIRDHYAKIIEQEIAEEQRRQSERLAWLESNGYKA